MRSASPAIRSADGPMSTPRRLPPRSRGTPMMWTAFNSAHLHRHGHPLIARLDDRSQEPRIRVDRVQEVAHFRLLVHDVVREQESARPEPGHHEIEEALVVALPRVEKHEVEGAGEL